MNKLFFSGTQEHALLTVVVQEARLLAEVRYLGRTALQKVVYFLKALDLPMRYIFEIHHYGPFSDQVASDIDLLIADGVIADQTQKTTYSKYGPADEGAIAELLSRHTEFVDHYRPLIRQVVSVFGRLTPSDLELYATVHYAYRYESAGGSRPTMEMVIRRFKAYKGDKFTDEQLRGAYRAMLSAKLIAPAE